MRRTRRGHICRRPFDTRQCVIRHSRSTLLQALDCHLRWKHVVPGVRGPHLATEVDAPRATTANDELRARQAQVPCRNTRISRQQKPLVTAIRIVRDEASYRCIRINLTASSNQKRVRLFTTRAKYGL